MSTELREKVTIFLTYFQIGSLLAFDTWSGGELGTKAVDKAATNEDWKPGEAEGEFLKAGGGIGLQFFASSLVAKTGQLHHIATDKSIQTGWTKGFIRLS